MLSQGVVSLSPRVPPDAFFCRAKVSIRERRMKVHRHAEKLVQYLRAHPQPTTVARIALAGVMTAGDASKAIQYGIQLGVIERIRRPGASQAERVQYRLTGQPLQPVRKAVGEPSFDALLTAWGIALVPPRLPACPPDDVTSS